MRSLSTLIRAAAVAAGLCASIVAAQTVREALGAAVAEPLAYEPPAKIIADPPLQDSLSQGTIVIQYRAENLHIVPVFGPAALAVSPRIGHVHVTVDDSPWGWAAATGDPIVIKGLPAGPHKVRIELVNPNHETIDQTIVRATVPESLKPRRDDMEAPPSQEPPAKLVIAAPLAGPLSSGVVFIPYRTENLHITPVFGGAALAVSPRVGHLHVAVDDAPWHWADTSGVPVIIQGLPPGPHRILIQLVNANHKPIDQGVVEVTVPSVHVHAGTD